MCESNGELFAWLAVFVILGMMFLNVVVPWHDVFKCSGAVACCENEDR